ncbi:MAG: amidohydrolase family protein, partial [Fimbriimonadales bacterium]
LLSPALQLVHCVRVEPREVEYIARSGAMVAHCPRSNARLLTGIAPVHAMRRMGIPVVVGTDSAVSAGTLDLWEEVRTAALLQRASSYSAVPSWRDWVAMLTLESAKAFGVGDTTGSLEVGKSADLIAVKTQRLAYTGTPDPYSALVLVTRSEDVALTMVRGEILYQEGNWRTLDPAQTRKSLRPILETNFPPIKQETRKTGV